MGKDTAPVYRAAWSALSRDLEAATLRFVDRQPSAAFGYELYVSEAAGRQPLWFMAMPYMRVAQVLLDPTTALSDFAHISKCSTDIQDSLANEGRMSCPTEEMVAWLRRHQVYFRLGTVWVDSKIQWEKWEGQPAYPVIPRRSA